MYADVDDTIAAISTPAGRGGIGVIRLSGSLSHKIACQLAPKCNPSRTRLAQFCSLQDPETSALIDQSIITFFKAPGSFTGQDAVELSCHGSPFVLSRVLQYCFTLGARPARPGEFTLRAFLNGKIDLTQAEAIRDLINAQSEYQARLAVRQMKGELSLYLQPLKEHLLEVIVHLESSVEFVDEALDTHSIDAIEAKLSEIREQLQRLSDSYRLGRLVREGLKLAIVGRPNVGKSSLFNALLQRDRAIVTDIPGTTRDSLIEASSIKGIPVHLIDTAGIRKSEDIVERLGIERSFSAIAEADLVLVVFDGTQPLSEEDLDILRHCHSTPHLIVLNKCDLGILERRDCAFIVSARTGEGIDKLQDGILSYLSGTESRNDTLVLDSRHHSLISLALSEIRAATLRLREGFSEEVALFHLHNALRHLGEITGETTVEDLLGQIFSTFCVGK